MIDFRAWPPEELRRRLIREQRRLGWYDREMAAALGISRTWWWTIRHGISRLGVKAANGAYARFPHLFEHLPTQQEEAR